MVYGSYVSAVAGLDFAALPPEINSGRMYLGPGSAPLMAAATAWDTVSEELAVAASGYASVISGLTGISWLGPTSVAMAAAVTPFVAWLTQTSGAAAEIAGQARAAAAAYEAAFAMTVPPPVIAANRSLLLALVATNFFGQNTAAIAATEAHYAQMWLQDATAMYVYAESSALATTLPLFREPPRMADAARPAADTAAQQLESALSSPLVQILEHVPNVTNSVLSPANAVTSGRGIYVTNLRLAAQQAGPPDSLFPSGARLVSGAAVPRPRISAAAARAPLVGKLSVPPSWVTVAPEMRPAAMVSQGPTAAGASADTAGCGSVFSQSVLGTLSRDGPQHSRAKSKPIIVRSRAAG